MNKKKVAIVMSGTSNLAFAMANVLIGLEKYSRNFASEVIIFHKGMSNEDQQCLRKLATCRFIEYAGHESINNLPTTDNIQKYSIMSFAIFEIFSFLEEFENVIYLDADLLLQKDISGILDYGPVAMGSGRLTINEACGSKPLPDTSTTIAKSSGVVIINDQLTNYETLTEQCYLHTAKLWYTLVFPDQAILNLVLNLNDVTINDLPPTYNTGKVNKNLHAAAIVHTQGGKSKFWNNGVSNIMFPEWNRNNELWISLGGTPYNGPRYYWGLHGISQAKLFDIIKRANSLGIEIM